MLEVGFQELSVRRRRSAIRDYRASQPERLMGVTLVRRFLITSVALGLVAGVTDLLLAEFSQAQTPPPPAQPVSPGPSTADFVEVEVREVGGILPVGGTVVPLQDVTFTAQVPGSVEFLAGEEGYRFKRQAVLVRLDAAQLKARRQAALAQIANAEASVRNAGVQYQRERRSPQSKSMMDQFVPGMGQWFGGQDKHERRADLYSQSIQIEQAQNALRQAQSQLREIDAKPIDVQVAA